METVISSIVNDHKYPNSCRCPDVCGAENIVFLFCSVRVEAMLCKEAGVYRSVFKLCNNNTIQLCQTEAQSWLESTNYISAERKSLIIWHYGKLNSPPKNWIKVNEVA